MTRLAAAMERGPDDPLELHRRHWCDGLDLDVMALVFALHRAHEATLSRARAVWAGHGLTPAEFDVLATLRRSPAPRELTPSQVQDALAITSGGLTKVMNSLEARGLVSRSRSEADQRIRPVKLSAPGKRLVERAMADVMRISGAAIRSTLTAEEMVATTGLLGKLAAGEPTGKG